MFDFDQISYGYFHSTVDKIIDSWPRNNFMQNLKKIEYFFLERNCFPKKKLPRNNIQAKCCQNWTMAGRMAFKLLVTLEMWAGLLRKCCYDFRTFLIAWCPSIVLFIYCIHFFYQYYRGVHFLWIRGEVYFI